MDRYQQKLSAYKDVSKGTVLLATDDLSSVPRLLIAAVAGYSIFVQRISIAVTTDNAATLTFQDNTAVTPLKVAGTKASPGIGPILFDFGADGYQMAEGKELDLANSAAGLAATIQVQAYQKAIGVATILVGNQVGGGTPGTSGSLEP